MQIVDAIEERGAPRVAKIVFSTLRTLFKYGLTRDFIEVDPTAGINKLEIGGKEVERDRVLNDDEIRHLARILPSAELIPTTEAAIWICLATGCRIGELLRARWEHIDIGSALNLYPSAAAKRARLSWPAVDGQCTTCDGPRRPSWATSV